MWESVPTSVATEQERAGDRHLGLLSAASFRERLIALTTMNPLARVVTILTFALLLMAGVAVALNGRIPLGPPIAYILFSEPQPEHLAAGIAVLSGAGLLLGYTVFLAGGIHGRAMFRGVVPTVFTVIFLIGDFFASGGEVANSVTVIAKIAVIMVIWGWALFVWYVSPPTPYARPAADWRVGVLPRVTFALMLALLAGYFTLVLLQPGSSLPLIDGGYVIAFLPVFLVVVALAGTDYVEMGDAVGSALARLGGGGLLPLLTAIVAWASGLIAALRLTPDLSGPRWAALVVEVVPPLLICAGLMAATLRLGRVGSWPRMTLPYGALVMIVAVLVSVGMTVGVVIVVNFANDPDAGARLLDALVAAVLLPLGMRMVRAYRQAPRPTAQAGVYLVAIGLVALYLFLAGTIEASLAAAFDWQPVLQQDQTLGIAHAQLALALVTLGYIFWLAVQRRIAGAGRALRTLLIGNAALQAVTLVAAIMPSTRTVTLGAALILLGSLGWDALTSGEQITNRDSPAFPRQSRVFIYLGYTLLAGTLILFSSTLTLTDQNTLGYDVFLLADKMSSFTLPFFAASLVLMSFAVEAARLAQAQRTGDFAAFDRVYEAAPLAAPTPEMIAREAEVPRTAIHYGVRFGLLAGVLTLVTVAIGAFIVVTYHDAFAAHALASARYIPACQARNVGNPTPDCSYPTLSYANDFTTMLFVSFGVALLVYALAAWASARRARRFAPGLGAALLALLINTLIFIAASCTASAARLNPLTFDQTDQDALVVTLVYTIALALFVALGTLVSASIGARVGRWQGMRAQARERAYAQARVPTAPPPIPPFSGYPPGGF